MKAGGDFPAFVGQCPGVQVDRSVARRGRKTNAKHDFRGFRVVVSKREVRLPVEQTQIESLLELLHALGSDVRVATGSRGILATDAVQCRNLERAGVEVG